MKILKGPKRYSVPSHPAPPNPIKLALRARPCKSQLDPRRDIAGVERKSKEAFFSSKFNKKQKKKVISLESNFFNFTQQIPFLKFSKKLMDFQNTTIYAKKKKLLDSNIKKLRYIV